MIELRKPTTDLAKDIFLYKQEMIDNGDESLHGCGGIGRADTFEEWMYHINQYSDRNNIKKDSNYVEGSQWVLLDTKRNRVLGMTNIRHYLNESLLQTGGHIGYSIRPSERRKGYAKLQLTLALDVLRHHGVTKALLTCDVNNIGSAKTIEACGGVLENLVYDEEHGTMKRYWITLQSETTNNKIEGNVHE